MTRTSVGIVGLWALSLLIVGLVVGCGGGGGSGDGSDSGDPAEPPFEPAKLTTTSGNTYLPLDAGTTHFYRDEAGGTGRVDVVSSVSHSTREVAGVDCTVVIDRTFVDGELTVETFGWFAEDEEGNLWTLGQESSDIEGGVPVATDSWEAGVGGALAGILMKANPIVGDTYRKEFVPGVVDQMAEVVAIDVPVALSDASTYTCVMTREWDPADPDGAMYRYYAPGSGLVLEETASGSNRTELEEIRVDRAPVIDPANFTHVVDNPHFPLFPGTVHRIEGDTSEGYFVAESYVTEDEKVVMGVSCKVVQVLEYLDGMLVEETLDWYAQDLVGNVWYMGEAVLEYEDGAVVSTEGSWEAGKDSAMPGIVMLANPRAGDTYRTEYRPGEAEDLAEVTATQVNVALGGIASFGTVQIREWDPLEEEPGEIKFYAPGIGLVRETHADGSKLDLTYVGGKK